MPDSKDDEGAQSTPVERAIEAPRKADFRQRAHCNPLTDAFMAYPHSPDHVDWRVHFPQPPSPGEPIPTNPSDPLYTTFYNTTNCPIEYPMMPVDKVFSGRAAYEAAATNAENTEAQWPTVQTGPHILDVGCGYGGMSLRLSEMFPSKCILGLEIREKVTEFVGYRIRAARAKVQKPPMGDIRPSDHIQPEDHHYCNVAVIRQNAMKFLPQYIRKGATESIVFCFPDPQFKKYKWRRRIINPPLLSQYSYCLKMGGRIYTVTDCYELHTWMVDSLEAHPAFNCLYQSPKPKSNMPRHAYDEDKDKVLETLTEEVKSGIEFTSPWNTDFGEALKDDPIPSLLTWSTEEGQKVLRNKMRCFISVFEKSC